MDFGMYFEWKDGVTMCGEPLRDEHVQEARDVLNLHIIPEQSTRLRKVALYFCIASQRTQYERALAFSNAIMNGSDNELDDPQYLVHHGQQAALLHSNDPRRASDPAHNRFLRAMTEIGPSIDAIAQKLLESPIPTRRELDRMRCNLAPKTASFWYLCMGGAQLMTLDTHNYRQLAGLFERTEYDSIVHRTHYAGRLRTDGRSINTTPSVKEYEQIEAAASALFGRCPRAQAMGGITPALATSLFWTIGAKKQRGINPAQKALFNEPKLTFSSPYIAAQPVSKPITQETQSSAKQLPLFY
jgi:hypothetical protein